MAQQAWLFNRVTALSRLQKWVIFVAVDMMLVALISAALLFAVVDFANPKIWMFLLALVGIAAILSVRLGIPRIKLNAYGRHAIVVTAKFASLTALAFWCLSRLLAISVDVGLAVEFAGLLILACICSRYTMLNLLLWVLRQGQRRQRVVIYGAGDTGLQMAIALRSHKTILPVAFVDDDAELQGLMVAGLPVLSPARLELSLRELAAERVLLAMPSLPAAKRLRIARKCTALGLDVQTLPSFGQLTGTDDVALLAQPEKPAHYLGRAEMADDVTEIASVYQGRVVLVSGAGGSVGAELCRQLMQHRPKMLILYERSELALYAIDRELREMAGAQWVDIVPVLGSVTDSLLARSTMRNAGVDVVFHAAAYKHVTLVEANPVAGLANNVLGTQIFAKAAEAAGVGRFVLVSTDKAVRPSSVMGATKRLAELVVQDLAQRTVRTQFSTVRFGNVLGSSGSVLPLFRDQILRGGPITLTHEDVTRYFMSLAEAARLVLLTGAFAQNAALHDVFVLDMGKPIKIRDLAERMIAAEGLTAKSETNPQGDIEIVVTGLRKGEKLHEDLLACGTFLPTAHPKILRTQDACLPADQMTALLDAAESAVQTGHQGAARAVLDSWIVATGASREKPRLKAKSGALHSVA